jgi:hypothetical protein
MSLTKRFNETISEMLQEDKEFRRAFLRESIRCWLSGDIEMGKLSLRQYINGTVGFIKLGADLGKSPKVLMRMFSATGNPQARNLFEVIAYLQKQEGTVLEVIEKKPAKPKKKLRRAA